MEKKDELQHDPVDVAENLEPPVETKKDSIMAYGGLALAILSLIISFNGIVALVAGILSFVQLYKAGANSKKAKLALTGFLVSLASLGYVMIRNLFW